MVNLLAIKNYTLHYTYCLLQQIYFILLTTGGEGGYIEHFITFMVQSENYYIKDYDTRIIRLKNIFIMAVIIGK